MESSTHSADRWYHVIGHRIRNPNPITYMFAPQSSASPLHSSMPPPRLVLFRSASNCIRLSRRQALYPRYSTSPTSSVSNPPSDASVIAALPARWLIELKRRIGKCIIFGLQQEQIDEAGHILKAVARDWRELVAGSEGFLTGKGRAGYEGREVVWGEMVSTGSRSQDGLEEGSSL